MVNGLCDRDYQRVRRHGDLGPVENLILVGGDLKVHLEVKVARSGGPDSCHPWTSFVAADGYGRLQVKRVSLLSHVVAWETANGRPVPLGQHVDHECHNRAVREGACIPGPCAHRRCCNPRHLVAKTSSEHAAVTDQAARDRSDMQGRTKLSWDQIPDIKTALAQGESLLSIAARFNVSKTTISDIKRGKSWTHEPWVRSRGLTNVI